MDIRVLPVGHCHDYEIVCHECDESWGLFVGAARAERLAELHRQWHEEQAIGTTVTAVERDA